MVYYKQIIAGIASFCSCAAIMAIFGDALAWHRMPKYNTIEIAKQHILDDAGFDLFSYYCPTPIGKNMQTTIILFSVSFIIIRGVFFMRNGQLIIQRLIHTSCIMMLMRTATLVVTSYPNPNPQCYLESTTPIDYFGANGSISQTISSFPTKSCGNLMFSGHTMFLTLFALFEYTYKIIPRKYFFLTVVKTAFGYYSIIACRSHYSIDVLVSFIVTNMTFQLYISHFPKWAEIPEIPENPNKFVELTAMV